MANAQAASDARHARTGKDGAFYDIDGELLATVESFTSNISFNNVSYTVLGNAQELEAPNTFKVSLTMSQIVIEDDKFIEELLEAMSGNKPMPSWNFRGELDGRDENSAEKVTYYECIPSGQVDLQNVAVGDVVKRNWNFHVNKVPTMTGKLSVKRAAAEA